MCDNTTESRAIAGPETIVYQLHGNCYLNLTQRCTLRCRFCPKFNGTWRVKDYDLRLHDEPSAEQLIAAAGDPRRYREVVFCGLGEPTLRLPTVLAVAERLRADGARIRLNTDGLASLTQGSDVTPELAGRIDALSVSLNGISSSNGWAAVCASGTFNSHSSSWLRSIGLAAAGACPAEAISVCWPGVRSVSPALLLRPHAPSRQVTLTRPPVT